MTDNGSDTPRTTYARGMRVWVVVAGIVVLASCGDGSELDGSWRAVSATVDGVDVAGLDAVVVTMDIDGDRITGSGGCNEYDTPADIGDGTITFGEGAATEQACEGPPDEIERLFYEFTSGSASWSIEGERLTMTTTNATWVFE